MTTTPTGLVDIAVAAERLGVTVRYVRRLVAQRRIPYVKFGHPLRFDPSELDAWIDRARVAEIADSASTPSPGPWSPRTATRSTSPADNGSSRR